MSKLHYLRTTAGHLCRAIRDCLIIKGESATSDVEKQYRKMMRDLSTADAEIAEDWLLTLGFEVNEDEERQLEFRGLHYDITYIGGFLMLDDKEAESGFVALKNVTTRGQLLDLMSALQM